MVTQRRVPGKILDLSLTGCLVRPDENGLLQEGNVVEISFSIYGYSVRATAAIRHIRSDQCMGIEFRKRSDDWQLTKLMEKLAAEWTRNQRPGADRL